MTFQVVSLEALNIIKKCYQNKSFIQISEPFLLSIKENKSNFPESNRKFKKDNVVIIIIITQILYGLYCCYLLCLIFFFSKQEDLV